MSTDEIKNLFKDSYKYAEEKFGKKPESIEIEEDGTIKAGWSTYEGCGTYRYTYETFLSENLTENHVID